MVDAVRAFTSAAEFAVRSSPRFSLPRPALPHHLGTSHHHISHISRPARRYLHRYRYGFWWAYIRKDDAQSARMARRAEAAAAQHTTNIDTLERQRRLIMSECACVRMRVPPHPTESSHPRRYHGLGMLAADRGPALGDNTAGRPLRRRELLAPLHRQVGALAPSADLLRCADNLRMTRAEKAD